MNRIKKNTCHPPKKWIVALNPEQIEPARKELYVLADFGDGMGLATWSEPEEKWHMARWASDARTGARWFEVCQEVESRMLQWFPIIRPEQVNDSAETIKQLVDVLEEACHEMLVSTNGCLSQSQVERFENIEAALERGKHHLNQYRPVLTKCNTIY